MSCEEVNSSEEQWRESPEFPNYEVSTLGRVRNIRWDGTRGRILKPYKYNYYYIKISANRKYYNRCVHKLVAEAFLGERPEGYEINHINGDRYNNRLDNLEYVSRAENVSHAQDLQLYSRKTRTRLSKEDVADVRTAYASGEVSQPQLAKKYDVCLRTISDIIRNVTWVD